MGTCRNNRKTGNGSRSLSQSGADRKRKGGKGGRVFFFGGGEKRGTPALQYCSTPVNRITRGRRKERKVDPYPQNKKNPQKTPKNRGKTKTTPTPKALLPPSSAESDRGAEEKNGRRARAIRKKSRSGVRSQKAELAISEQLSVAGRSPVERQRGQHPRVGKTGGLQF